MKKYILSTMLLSVCAFLSACGTEAAPENAWKGVGPGADLTALTERTEYYDIAVETEQLFDLGLWEQNPEEFSTAFLVGGGILYVPLGTQFAAGEPAQIWSELSYGSADVYLYRTDGSRELLLEGISPEYASSESHYRCYADQEGNCYFYRTDFSNADGEYKYIGTLVKMLPSGEVLYESKLEPGYILDSPCQSEDGKIYLQLNRQDDSKLLLEELDPGTGQVIPQSRMEPDLWAANLGIAGNDLMLAGYGSRTNGRVIVKADMSDGTMSDFLFLSGTSYGWHGDLSLRAFRVLEDNSMELLWTDQNGLGCFLERLRMEKVEKTPIVCRGSFHTDDSWLKDQISRFNQTNDSYQVVLEDCGFDNDIEDFARLTSVQMSAGKGPDILCGDVLFHDYIGGMIEKGSLEELNPWLEASGIREADYFPLTFSSWRQGEKIYGVTPKMEVHCEEISQEALGLAEVPDIEALADALLAREGKGVYRKGFDSGQTLLLFLQGSESLWGMIDWGNGVCDFDTPLFAKLLEAAKRYGDDGRKELETAIADSIDLDSFFSFNGTAEQAAEGRVSSGILFDDGCYGESVSGFTMAINVNSAHKDGAWEFISFLLGEEVQYREEWSLPPVHRKSFDRWLDWYIRDLSQVRFENGHEYHPPYVGADTSEEKREEYRQAIEEARPLPARTAPVLAIILEEAEDYFNGSKSAEEVSSVINNRVMLYLEE